MNYASTFENFVQKKLVAEYQAEQHDAEEQRVGEVFLKGREVIFRCKCCTHNFTDAYQFVLHVLPGELLSSRPEKLQHDDEDVIRTALDNVLEEQIECLDKYESELNKYDEELNEYLTLSQKEHDSLINNETHFIAQQRKKSRKINVDKRQAQSSNLRNTSKPVLKCLRCPFYAASFQKLNQHMRNIHSLERCKHKCHYCEESFVEKSQLNLHLRQRHKQNAFSHEIHRREITIENPFSCDNCGQRFATSLRLIEHKRRKCQEQLTWICDVGYCNKSFKIKKDLAQHKLQHLGAT